VILTDRGEDGERRDLVWSPGMSGVRDILLDAGGSLLFLTEDELARFSADGAQLSRISLSATWDEAYFSGGRLHLVSRESGNWMIIDPDLSRLSQGQYRGPGRFYTAVALAGGSGVLTFSYDARGFRMTDQTGGSYHLLQLEEQWNFLRISRSGNWFYLADSAWRLHRIDISTIARDFVGAVADVSAPPNPQDTRAAFLIGLLQASLSQPRELERQLDGIEAVLRSGDYRGRLLMYEDALSEFLDTAYADGPGGGFVLGDPALRAKTVGTLLSCGGDRVVGRVVSALSAEISPEVFLVTLTRLKGISHPAELELARVSLRFLVGADSWQRPDALSAALFDYLVAILDAPPERARGGEVNREIIGMLERLYVYLDDPAMRRRVLRLNS
jgi:hypothetical protein